MARQKNDGRGRLGGRTKNTPNKITSAAKEVITEIVNNNAPKAQQQLDLLVDPKDWLFCYIKLLEFVVPKKASVNVQEDIKLSDLRSELMELANKEE